MFGRPFIGVIVAFEGPSPRETVVDLEMNENILSCLDAFGVASAYCENENEVWVFVEVMKTSAAGFVQRSRRC